MTTSYMRDESIESSWQEMHRRSRIVQLFSRSQQSKPLPYPSGNMEGNMRITQLEYFESVARNLSFTKASEECHVAQPAVSRKSELWKKSWVLHCSTEPRKASRSPKRAEHTKEKSLQFCKASTGRRAKPAQFHSAARDHWPLALRIPAKRRCSVP